MVTKHYIASHLINSQERNIIITVYFRLLYIYQAKKENLVSLSYLIKKPKIEMFLGNGIFPKNQ